MAQTDASREAGPQAKLYEPPLLFVIGSVEELTMSMKGGPHADVLTNKS